MQKKKGVSLIVLSITILVMAIIAATAIIALEESGIIGSAKTTALQQSYKDEYTRLNVIKNGILTSNLGEITVDEYITELQNKNIVGSSVITNTDGSKTVTTTTGFDVNVIQKEDNIIISVGTSKALLKASTNSITHSINSGENIINITLAAENILGNVVWTTSNADVATVVGTNDRAQIIIKNEGSAVITATQGGKKEYITVTATAVPPTVSLSKSSASYVIKTGTTKTDTLTATTNYAASETVWTTSNSSVATVVGNGNTATVTIKGAGTATITATLKGVSKSCTYTVTADDTAPTFSMYADGTSYSIYTSITGLATTATDYPLTVQYYYKYDGAADSSYVLDGTETKTSGTSYNYTYNNISPISTFILKVVVTDAAGNSTTKTTTVYPVACFVAGTQILTESGMKNIEDVKLGEKVYTVNLDTNQKELKVVNKLIRDYTLETYELKIGDETVITTPRHRFYIQDKGWVRAYDLEVGDKIVAKGSETDMVITAIEYKVHTEEIPVFNLTVDGHHNYLVTKYELLVHNATSPT